MISPYFSAHAREHFRSPGIQKWKDGAVSDDPDDTAVLAANLAFYTALEAGDLSAMSALWAHESDVLCAHPGRGPLRGWSDVEKSWEAIFASGGNPQIIVTDAVTGRRGPLAWVSATENLLGAGSAGAATALNIFHLVDDEWRMVAHHAGPLMG